MRKILIFTTVAFFAFYSCKKEAATKSPANLQTLSTPSVSANGTIAKLIGVDLTGFQLLDMCSHEICSTIGGTAVFYIASDGNVTSPGVYNFVFWNNTATTYRGEYGVSLEPFTGYGAAGNTYKLIVNPRGVSPIKLLLAMVRINAKESGVYTIQIESGTVECH